jgi:hypothetical protein
MFGSGKDSPSHEHITPRGKVLFLNTQSESLDHSAPDLPVTWPEREQKAPDGFIGTWTPPAPYNVPPRLI